MSNEKDREIDKLKDMLDIKERECKTLTGLLINTIRAHAEEMAGADRVITKLLDEDKEQPQ